MKVSSDKPERTTGSQPLNNGISAVVSIFIYFASAVFHEDEGSANKLEGVFAQRHSFMKATYRRKY